MLRDITIGQYYPSGSVLHRLDPRVKLFWTLLYIVSMFVFNTFLGYVVAGVTLIVLIKISHVPFKFMVKGLKAVWMLLIFTLVLNLFMTSGEVIWQWKFLKLTKEGIRTAVFMGLRLFFLIIGSSLMTLTTTPNQLTDGLETGLRGLKKIKVPVHELAMMMSIALRFIPTLIEETDKIMSAQKARGAEIDTGSFTTRAKNLISILVPLFISAFRRADELATAMECRCYHGGEGRTRLRQLKSAPRDYIALAVTVFFLVLVIVLGRLF